MGAKAVGSQIDLFSLELGDGARAYHNWMTRRASVTAELNQQISQVESRIHWSKAAEMPIVRSPQPRPQPGNSVQDINVDDFTSKVLSSFGKLNARQTAELKGQVRALVKSLKAADKVPRATGVPELPAPFHAPSPSNVAKQDQLQSMIAEKLALERQLQKSAEHFGAGLADAVGIERRQETIETLWALWFEATRLEMAEDAKKWQLWLEALGPWFNASGHDPSPVECIGKEIQDYFASTTGVIFGVDFRLRLSYLDRRVHAKLEARVSTSQTFTCMSKAVAPPGSATQKLRALARVAAVEAGVIKTTLRLADWEASEVEPFAWTTTDLAAAQLLVAAAAGRADRLCVEWQTPRPRVRRALTPREIAISGRNHGGWFAVKGHVEVDGSNIDIVDLVRAVRSGVRYVPLANGDLAEIDAALALVLRPFGSCAEQSDGYLQVPKLIAVAAALQVGSVGGDLGAVAEAVARANAGPLELPESVGPLQLHVYQIEGVRWLLRQSTWAPGALLADDMGLGKTRQILALLAARAPLGGALVVAPSSLVEQWTKGPDVGLVTDDATSGSQLRFTNDATMRQGAGAVLVVSYDFVVRNAARLAEPNWATIVLDEAHYAKNSQSKRARALMRLNGAFKVAVSGTPIENHVGEFWSIAQLFAPGWLGSRDAFLARYAASDRHLAEEAAIELGKILPLFVLRRRRHEQLATLPPLSARHQHIAMTAAENDQYEAKALLAARSIRAKLSKLPDAQKRISALDLLRQLRESAAHPALVDDNAGDRSSKVDWLVEQLECDARNGEQSLVFSQWTRVLDRIARVLVDSGIAHARLDGSMPNSVRKRACADLNQGRVAVLLLTIGAGGVGLNLQSASRVYVYDPWWNPQKEIQAICRAHRQGQQKPVVAIHLIAQDTVEERIVALQQKKMDIFDAVMEGAERGGGLTTAQLIELIAPAAMEL